MNQETTNTIYLSIGSNETNNSGFMSHKILRKRQKHCNNGHVKIIIF